MLLTRTSIFKMSRSPGMDINTMVEYGSRSVSRLGCHRWGHVSDLNKLSLKFPEIVPLISVFWWIKIIPKIFSNYLLKFL